MPSRTLTAALLSVSSLALAGYAFAETPAPAPAPAIAADAPVTTIIIFGRGKSRINTATAASEGTIAGADLTVRPLLRIGELLESVPGMIVTQHSGSGKANQYYLRGFNLDHGTDFSFELDGVPMNFRTHGHGQGYLDINSLIPETVKQVDYRKGPYRADSGDFALVGQARATTVDSLTPFLSVGVGAFDWKRLAGGGSFKAGDSTITLVGQAQTYDGPWQLPEKLRHLTLFGKWVKPLGEGTLRATATIYHATWQPTEQIPERAIGNEIADTYGALDMNLRGRTDRQIFTLAYERPGFRVMTYAQHYDWDMVSNFTFFLDDPVNGDELDQMEKLWTYGGRAEKDFTLSDTVTLKVGTEGRWDNINRVGLYHAIDGVRDEARTLFAVEEVSGALYSEVKWTPSSKFSAYGGLRGDAYGFTVKGRSPDSWSGETHDSIMSPSLDVTYKPLKYLAFYGNWGQGFHSNDARGVTNPDSPAPGLVKGTGKELGVRFERGKLVLTANHWWMDVDSELLYVGDSGSVEPSVASTRYGDEFTAFLRPKPWLAIDATYSRNHARYVDSPGHEYVPGAIESSGEVGVSAVFAKWNASARYRYLGPHPLTDDNLVRAESTKILNLRAALTPGRYEFYVELLNALDSDGKDVEYYYTSRLPGEPPEGVDDIHSRAVEPRMMRAGVKITF
ncbi:TonB-dependent receptor [Asticcacaulis sp.]|uniref:TonB-dependent receptor n=1 Tax=Asticcacaulis sp. TaxID=1872648 RepID=UPI002B5C9B00|nr:TonB-dependent receptor [Asticcacaulis sp.]HTM81584.1 TonB-dependent receptor [Asticcacaulis sp.]